MRNRQLTAVLLMILLCLTAALCPATAEETFVCRGELSWLGGLPEYELPAVRSRSDLETYLVSQLQKLPASIDVSAYGIAERDFGQLYWGILNEHPELFYVDGMFFYQKKNGIVTAIQPKYLSGGEELEGRIAAFEAAVDRIVDYASASTTDVGKLLLVNDYICMHYCYDESNSVFSAEQFFLKGKGVCQAYTMAYKAVLNELGFTNTVVSSSAMGHMWNVVLLDGSWYHVDVTWNDPLNDKPLRAMHRNFLLSDAAMQDRDHYGWTQKVTASDTRYDSFFWRSVNQPIPAQGDKLFYMDPNAARSAEKLYSWQPGTGSKLLYTFNAYDLGGSYDVGYDPLALSNGRLFYLVGKRIYSVDLTGSDRRLENTFQADGQYPYSAVFSQEENRMKIALASESSHAYQQILTVWASLPESLSFANGTICGKPGQSYEAKAVFVPAYSSMPCTYTSSDPAVAGVDAAGRITALSPGVAMITAAAAGGLKAECAVVVHYSNALWLPSGLKTLEESSFEGSAVRDVIVPEGTLSIGKRAFANCSRLDMITIPASVTEIAADAFAGTTGLTVLCTEGSAAHSFAVKNSMPHCILRELP